MSIKTIIKALGNGRVTPPESLMIWHCQLPPRAQHRCVGLKQLQVRSHSIQQRLCPKSLLRQRASIIPLSVKGGLQAQCPMWVPPKKHFMSDVYLKVLYWMHDYFLLFLIWPMQQENPALPRTNTQQQSICLMESIKESIPASKTCGSQAEPLLTKNAIIQVLFLKLKP